MRLARVTEKKFHELKSNMGRGKPVEKQVAGSLLGSGDVFKCILCKQTTPMGQRFISESCNHAACQSCASKHCEQSSQCWLVGCNKIITNMPNDLDRKRQLRDDVKSPDLSSTIDMFMCQCCQQEYPQEIELFINSNCLDTCCKTCASKHIMLQIEKKVLPMACWVSECKQPLDLTDCQRVVSEDVLQRFQETSLQKWTSVDEAVEGVSVIRCCDNFCDWFFTVDKKDVLPKWVTCRKCSVTFCPKCRMSVHDELSCESNLKNFNQQACTYSKLAEEVYAQEVKLGQVVDGYECVHFQHQFAGDATLIVPCPQYAIFEHEESKEIVVSFRGTNNMFDALVDFSFVQSVDQGGAIHFGIDRHLSLVREDVLKLLLLKDRADQRKLTLTGHSLGGGYSLALLVHVLQNEEILSAIESIKVMTFGAPLIFAKDSLEELMHKKPSVKVEIWNFVHNDDIVPRFLGENLYGGSVMSLLKGLRVIGKEQADMFAQMEKTFSLFKPIGNFVFLRRSGIYNYSYKVEVEAGGPDMSTRRKDLWKINWPLTCLADHKLKNYTDVLALVAKQ
eukprot:TRINITY_DN3064_c0_g1_i1.p1 TRINITY_DN3064_c0_g1~~TRINITY_DN3064_c0_g1_i1.p1  ORF type:complete len:562 (-),score=111.87 TRINITY_DN3064_c0_g1_i1:32-1717(-)